MHFTKRREVGPTRTLYPMLSRKRSDFATLPSKAGERRAAKYKFCSCPELRRLCWRGFHRGPVPVGGFSQHTFFFRVAVVGRCLRLAEAWLATTNTGGASW